MHLSSSAADVASGQLARADYHPKKSIPSLDVQLKRLSEQEKFTLLKEKIDAIERTLDAEVCRRQDGDCNLQAHVDGELHKLSERTCSDMKQLQLAIKSSVEQLGRSVHELNTIVSEEREQRKVDIDHVGTHLCERINEVVQTVDEERFSRLEQERQSLKRYATGLCEPPCHQSPQRSLCWDVAGNWDCKASSRQASSEHLHLYVHGRACDVHGTNKARPARWCIPLGAKPAGQFGSTRGMKTMMREAKLPELENGRTSYARVMGVCGIAMCPHHLPRVCLNYPGRH